MAFKTDMDLVVDGIQAIPAYADMSKRKIRQILDLFIADVADRVKKGKEVRIQGLGKITTTKTHRPAHEARNPRTGEPVKVSAKNVIRTRFLLEKTIRTEMAK